MWHFSCGSDGEAQARSSLKYKQSEAAAYRATIATMTQTASPPAAMAPDFMESAVFEAEVLTAAVPLPAALVDEGNEAEDVVAATSFDALLDFGPAPPAPPVGAPELPVAAGGGEEPAPPGAALPGAGPEPVPPPDPKPSGPNVGWGEPAGWHC